MRRARTRPMSGNLVVDVGCISRARNGSSARPFLPVLGVLIGPYLLGWLRLRLRRCRGAPQVPGHEALDLLMPDRLVRPGRIALDRVAQDGRALGPTPARTSARSPSLGARLFPRATVIKTHRA